MGEVAGTTILEAGRAKGTGGGGSEIVADEAAAAVRGTIACGAVVDAGEAVASSIWVVVHGTVEAVGG